MSWDGYIDNCMNHSKDATGKAHCDKVCIFGLTDGSMWTSTSLPSSLPISQEEAEKLATAIRTDDYSKLQQNGIMIDKVKYQFLRSGDRTVYAKRAGEGSLAIQASRTAVVAGHCPEGSQPGNLNKAVAVIADYLTANDI